MIKPDLVNFGGTASNPYLFAGSSGDVLQTYGTSFATPGTARIASGVRAHFGAKLTPMVLKALLVHCAERDDDEHDTLEVGWGRVPHDIQQLTVCPPGHVRVIYSGKLVPGAVLRAPILVPPGLTGNARIRATVCYSCRTDPNTPGDYTRAGLDVTFRPDATDYRVDDDGKRSANPVSDSFFKKHDHIPEDERRLLAQKWNTVMHAENGKRISSLKEPCFDLHYVARAPGLSVTPGDAPDIHYAMVISLIQERTPDLYERVTSAFTQVVSPIQPIIDIVPPVSI